ncbi:MAG: HNH endonuclease [Candidatus Babeliaceae bacterium]|nr:HNH endonuclease [Candidatus Babeliaceae bacterium]
MKINEAAQFLCWSRDQVKAAIETGIEKRPGSLSVKLKALTIGKEYDICDEELDKFIGEFYSDEPKRNIPTDIRRKLLVEARYRCAVCSGTSSLEFHHIIEYSEIAHHDPQHMVVLCATCHNRCTKGEIDALAQREFKKRLQLLYPPVDDFPARFSWGDLRKLIIEMHELMSIENPSSSSKSDFLVIDIEKKNELNKMSPEYYEFMRDNHQPYFGRIEEFLRNPANEKIANLYYEIVDELNSKIAAERDRFDGFENVMVEIRDSAKTRLVDNPRTLNVLLSFTYFKCDVGRKNA